MSNNIQPGGQASPEIGETGITIVQLQNRLAHYLSPLVAQDVNLSLSDLQGILSGNKFPDQGTMYALCRRLGLVRR